MHSEHVFEYSKSILSCLDHKCMFDSIFLSSEKIYMSPSLCKILLSYSEKSPSCLITVLFSFHRFQWRMHGILRENMSSGLRKILMSYSQKSLNCPITSIILTFFLSFYSIHGIFPENICFQGFVKYLSYSEKSLSCLIKYHFSFHSFFLFYGFQHILLSSENQLRHRRHECCHKVRLFSPLVSRGRCSRWGISQGDLLSTRFPASPRPALLATSTAWTDTQITQ